MEITTFNLSNPWRTGKNWDVPGIQRDVTRKLMNWLDEPEILILSGARQVGKTSILYQLIDWLMRSGHVGPDGIYYFNLDLGGISEFLEDQGSFLRFLEAEKGRNIFVFIDEVQRLPDPGIFIKAIQDLRLPIKFILTGSSSLDIRSRTHEPLTGRKQVFHIEALSFSEYVKTVPVLSSLPALEQQSYSIYIGALNDALNDYGLYGGYPAVVLTDDPEKKILRLNEIFSSYLEKDIAGFLKVENIPAFRKLATLLSVQQGGLVNIQELASTLGLHRETITRYIYYLEETFVIKRLTPLFTGKIIEGIVVSHVLRDRILSHRINYWRTKSGAEVDLIISGAKPVQSIEVKSGFLKGVTISRGYRSFLSKYSPKKAILLNSAIWSKREIAGHTVEAIPTTVFLLREPGSDKKGLNI
ncbi:MAG: ATP-binding protein [Deltaproteobacteria bacterium]|nr:ATP-binding protein [Deltaproteobacteria bacterium]